MNKIKKKKSHGRQTCRVERPRSHRPVRAETLTFIGSGYRQSAHAVPVLGLVAVGVLQHKAVTRPRDFTDGFALDYALESGSLTANYSYVF